MDFMNMGRASIPQMGRRNRGSAAMEGSIILREEERTIWQGSSKSPTKPGIDGYEEGQIQSIAILASVFGSFTVDCRLSAFF